MAIAGALQNAGGSAHLSQSPAPTAEPRPVMGDNELAASWLQPSIRRLQPGRSQPLADVSADLGLPGFADCTLTLDAWWKRSGFRMESLRLFGKALFKGRGVLDMASLHGAAPFRRRRERWWRSHHRSKPGGAR
ncbi:hypothetical protein CO678_29105 [Bradyrhizobium diazoefficiens]|nr:hypothetical protein CO678_29105 [Bradyrhizobium diazoefficiens]